MRCRSICATGWFMRFSAWRSACSAGTDCPGHIDEAFSHVWAVRDRIGQGEDFTGYGPALADFVHSLHALWAATPNDLGIPVGIPQIRFELQPSPRRGCPRNRLRRDDQDRKSTRLNSSHMSISYAVFCLKKKKQKKSTLFIKQKKKKTTR